MNWLRPLSLKFFKHNGELPNVFINYLSQNQWGSAKDVFPTYWGH